MATGQIGYRFWAYKPKPDGRTDGAICGYCFKVFCARWQTKINPSDGKAYTMTSLLVHLGGHEDDLAKVLKYSTKVIEYYIEKGIP
jgi:hypothetical protein